MKDKQHGTSVANIVIKLRVNKTMITSLENIDFARQWADSENVALAKQLADVIAKPAGDPIRELCTTIANSLPYGGTAIKLQFVTTTNNVEVKLVNSAAITALRFEIEFGRRYKYKVPELCARIQNLNTNINFQENILTFVLLDIDGKGIAPGEGTIVSIPLENDDNFKVTAAYASSRVSGLREIEYTISHPDSSDGLMVLEQNDPNPFNVSTKIEFKIPDACEVKVAVYDVNGALIRTLLNSILWSGIHKVEWDGKDDGGNAVESGIYLYKLYAGVYSLTKKMVFAK